MGDQMKVRDRDLRNLVHEHGAGPGTDLHRVLAELQRRRDEADEEDGRSGPSPRPGIRRHRGAAPI